MEFYSISATFCYNRFARSFACIDCLQRFAQAVNRFHVSVMSLYFAVWSGENFGFGFK